MADAILILVLSRCGRDVHVRAGGLAMADKNGLRIFGLWLGGVTIAVALVAAVTVQAQINGRMAPGAINPHTLALPR